MKYKKIKLKEVCTVNQGLQIPISKRFKEAGNNRYFYITIQFLKGNSENYYIENPKKSVICNKEDILVVRTGSTGVVLTGVEGCFHNNFFKVVPKNNIFNKYLYYSLNNKEMYEKMLNAASGTTIPDLKHSSFYELEIPLPEYCEQVKIAKILNIIDKKIELNTHTNNNLYAIGKALYQEYFENEKYTSNYETKQLSDVTTNNRNKIDQSKEYKVLSAVNTGNLVLSDDYFDKQVYSKDIGKYLNVNKYDFAYNPARINIGSIGLNTFDFNCCVSPVYITFSVDKDYIDFFDFYFKSKKFNAEVTLRASGSVRQALNYNDFGMIEIPYPTKEMIDKFNNSYKTLKERININKIKIRNLEQLRDTLLPKLMNGEIDLDKVEI